MGFDEKKRFLYPFVILAQVLGLVAEVLFLWYTISYAGGLGFDESVIKNLHPVLMISSLIYLNGTTIILYRTFASSHKTRLKAAHAFLHFTTLVLVIVSLCIRFKGTSTNLTSIHGWVGILTVTIFATQWVISLMIFIPNAIPHIVRDNYRMFHVYTGGCLLYSATVAVLIGIAKANHFTAFSTPALLLNFTGLCVIFFAIVTGIILSTEAYRRPLDASEIYKAF